MADGDNITAVTPDGVQHVFPAGTPDAVIDGAIKLHLGLTTGQGMMTPKAPVPTPPELMRANPAMDDKQLSGAGLVPFNSATAGVGTQLDDPQRIAMARAAAVQGGTEVGTLGVGALAETLSSTAAASKLFSYIKGVAGTHTVPVTEDVGRAAFEVQKLQDTIGGAPQVMKNWLKRAAESNVKPITYEEARNFYSGLTKLTTEEAMTTKPQMQWAITQFANAWGKEIAATAGRAGQGENFARAMAEYENAKKTQAVIKTAKGMAGKAALGAGGAIGVGAAGGFAAKKIYEATK